MVLLTGMKTEFKSTLFVAQYHKSHIFLKGLYNLYSNTTSFYLRPSIWIRKNPFKRDRGCGDSTKRQHLEGTYSIININPINKSPSGYILENGFCCLLFTKMYKTVINWPKKMMLVVSSTLFSTASCVLLIGFSLIYTSSNI